MYEYSHMGGFGIAMGLFLLFVFAAIVWFVMSMLNKRPTGGPNPAQESPLELLKKRYALGEIDDEEYQLRKKRLEDK